MYYRHAWLTFSMIMESVSSLRDDRKRRELPKKRQTWINFPFSDECPFGSSLNSNTEIKRIHRETIMQGHPCWRNYHPKKNKKIREWRPHQWKRADEKKTEKEQIVEYTWQSVWGAYVCSLPSCPFRNASAHTYTYATLIRCVYMRRACQILHVKYRGKYAFIVITWIRPPFLYEGGWTRKKKIVTSINVSHMKVIYMPDHLM